MFGNFKQKDLAYLPLGLFMGIWYFWCHCKWKLKILFFCLCTNKSHIDFCNSHLDFLSTNYVIYKWQVYFLLSNHCAFCFFSVIEKDFNFLPLIIMFAERLYGYLHQIREVFSISGSLRLFVFFYYFKSWIDLEFYQMHFLHLWDDMIFSMLC